VATLGGQNLLFRASPNVRPRVTPSNPHLTFAITLNEAAGVVGKKPVFDILLRTARDAASISRLLRIALMIAPASALNVRSAGRVRRTITRLSPVFGWAAPLPGYESFLHHWDLGYGPVDGSLSV
jgi:hypothetical protein